MTKRTLRKAVIPGRAQDWILSVLNPIIRCLRMEVSTLKQRVWEWDHERHRFEVLRPIADYVAEVYRGNLEDFLVKHPRLQKQFDDHDRRLEDLAQAVEEDSGRREQVASRRLLTSSWILHDNLRRLRIEIADRYGVRIEEER